MGFDLDLDDPEDAILVLAAIDEDDRGDGSTGIQRTPRQDVSRAGCGCVGCLLPTLAIAAATVAGLGALPLAAGLGLIAAALALVDHGQDPR